jgi:hypothetical protein
MLMLQLKFSPFVKNIEFVYWKRGSFTEFEYYSHPIKDAKQFNERAIVEVFYDQQAPEVLKKYQSCIKGNSVDGDKNNNQKQFNAIVSPNDVRIVDKDMSYAEWIGGTTTIEPKKVKMMYK